MGMQEASGGMWLQILIGRVIQTRLLEKSVFDPDSDDCVQASWQGPLFSEIARPWNLGMCFGDFGLKSGRRCAGFLAGAFFSEISGPWNFGTWKLYFGPKFGRRCAGFLAGAFFSEITRPWNLGMCFGHFRFVFAIWLVPKAPSYQLQLQH